MIFKGQKKKKLKSFLEPTTFFQSSVGFHKLKHVCLDEFFCDYLTVPQLVTCNICSSNP